MRSTLIVVAVALLAASCAAEVDALSPDRAYFSAETAGGCAQMGPNCVRYVVYGDGTVEAFRVGVDDAEPVATGSVDPELVSELDREARSVDQDALLAGLPPGECRGCYDGIDTTMWFFTSPRGSDPAFSSVAVDLDQNEPLLDLGWELLAAAQAVVEIPIVSR
jgi:hypothetical protein